jgi:hypothetical protein
MEDPTERHAAIRRFLLGQVPEASAEQTEERIFADPDFAEEVRMVEGELMEAYRSGDLSLEERGLFELKYLTSPAGLRAVAYEDAFIDFVRAKSDEGRLAGEEVSRAEAAARPEAEAGEPRRRKAPRRGALAALLHAFRPSRRAAAFSVLAAVALLAAALVWLQSRRQAADPGRLNPAQAERPAREAELARLNADGPEPSGREVAAVTLSAAERNAGATQRAAVSDDRPDGLVTFRLNLARGTRGRYRALFFDDRQNELFAVSNLAARATAEDPHLWLVVPARYFTGGDYRIALIRTDGGSHTQEGSYSFRVTRAR